MSLKKCGFSIPRVHVKKREIFCSCIKGFYSAFVISHRLRGVSEVLMNNFDDFGNVAKN